MSWHEKGSITNSTLLYKNKKVARQFFIIFGCLALGEMIVWATGIKLPSSIIGMLLLTFFLKMGWVKLHWIKRLSELLIANLGFFFVPPGVAIMQYLGIIKAEWLPITAATLVSTIIVLIVTGQMHQFVIWCERKMIYEYHHQMEKHHWHLKKHHHHHKHRHHTNK